MLGHVAGIVVECISFAVRISVVAVCFAELMHSKPRRKKFTRYAGPPLSLEAQRDQAAGDAQGALFS